MMSQLETKDGIKCDICGSEHRKRFTYFSHDGVPNPTTSDHLYINYREVELSYDLCRSCNDKISLKVVGSQPQFLNNLKKNNLTCEISGKQLSIGPVGNAFAVRVCKYRVDVNLQPAVNSSIYYSYFVFAPLFENLKNESI